MLYKFLLYNTVVQLCVYMYAHIHRCGVSLVIQEKAPTCNAGDVGLIPGLGRSPGEGNGNPLQYPYLGNPMDRGAWQAIVYGFTKELDTI